MARLAPSAATIALVPPDALMCAGCPFRRSSRALPTDAVAVRRPLCAALCDERCAGRSHRGVPQTRHRGPEDVPTPDTSAFSPAGTKRTRRGQRRCSSASEQQPRPGAQQDLRGRAREVVRRAPAYQDVAGEPELVDRGLVDLLAAGSTASGRRTPGSLGLEADDAQQFGDVDVLGGQAAAQDVVGVGHDLDAEAVEVGVRDAGAEEQGLAGLQSYVVEQHRGDDAGVARVVVGDVGVRGVRAWRRPVRRPRAAARPRPAATVSAISSRSAVSTAVSTSRSAASSGLGVQQVDVRLEGVDVRGPRAGRRPPVGARKPHRPVERRERADQFGLVVGVLVVAVRGVDRDAARLLVRVALLRLRQVGVHLEGERGAGGEDLEQERQPGPEGGDGRRAQLAFRVGGDRPRRAPAPAPRSTREGAPGWAPIHISACGSPVGSVPSSCGDGGGGAPGVGADGVVEAVHACACPVCSRSVRGRGGPASGLRGQLGASRSRSVLSKRAPGKRRRNP